MSEVPKDRARRASTVLCFLVFALLSALAATSRYRLAPSEGVTADVAMMLTPYGIFRNLVLTEDHPLRGYYYQPTTREGFHDRPALLALVAPLWLLGLAFLLSARVRR